MTRMRPRKRNRPPRRRNGQMKKYTGIHSFPVDSNPPAFTTRPWFPLTLRLFNPGTNITIGSIINSLALQLGSSDTTFTIRFLDARFWAAIISQNASTALSALSVTVLDIFQNTLSTTETPLQSYADFPDQVRRSCIAFAYSDAQRNLPINSTTTATNVVYRTQGMGAGSVVYLRILWRFSGTVPPIV